MGQWCHLKHLTFSHFFLSTEHIETMMQLLTAVVKKFPLIVPHKSKVYLHLQFFFFLLFYPFFFKASLWCNSLKANALDFVELYKSWFVFSAEDSHPFCASSTEQYYSWTIGKRRASEVAISVSLCVFLWLGPIGVKLQKWYSRQIECCCSQ